MNNINRVSRRTLVLGVLALFLATTTQAYHTGIGGDSDGEGDVALAGCTCHAEEPDNAWARDERRKYSRYLSYD